MVRRLNFSLLTMINLGAEDWPKSLVALLWEPLANKSERFWTQLYLQPWPLRAQAPRL